MALGDIFLSFLYGLEILVNVGFSKIWMRGKSGVNQRIRMQCDIEQLGGSRARGWEAVRLGWKLKGT